MRLIALEESKLESLLIVLEQLASTVDDKSLAEVTDLGKYIRARIETAAEVKTCSEAGQIGGCSRSKKKLDAARKNAEKAGPPGQYYGRIIVAHATSEVPAQAIDFYFPNKQSRDNWLNGSGSREALPAVDRDLRLLKLKDAETLADGFSHLRARLERQRLMDLYEQYNENMTACDGCGDLVERKFVQILNSNSLCSECRSAIRFLRKR